MNINLLKIFSGHVITTSKMSSSVKEQLLKYVQEGSEAQVKAFLLDGEIMKDPDDLVCKEIIDLRFNSSSIPFMIENYAYELEEESLLEGPVGSIAGMIFWTPMGWAAWRAATGLLSKKRRYCGTFRISSERDKCLEKYKMLVQEKKVESLRSDLKGCGATKDPKSCKAKVEKQIGKAEAKLNFLRRRFEDRWTAPRERAPIRVSIENSK